MNDDQKNDNLTREQYRQQNAQQPDGGQQETPDVSEEPSRSRLHRKRGGAKAADAQPNQPFENDQPEPNQEPTSRMQPTGPLTPEQKQKRLAHRLNIAIIVLVVLIALVYVVLRFVG
ncbi:MAG TPA: hypothetical protein DCW31_09135 [Lactobacillus sp.]|nr:hypothetical protein [Lactobacillus sp.]